jgi:hypothetical protein
VNTGRSRERGELAKCIAEEHGVEEDETNA